MAFFRALTSASGGGGNADWIPAVSYPTKGISYEWDYIADSAILLFNFRESYNDIMYIDFSNPTVVDRGTFGGSGKISGSSFSSMGLTFTLDASKKKCTLTHNSYGFSDAYIIPLVDSV